MLLKQLLGLSPSIYYFLLASNVSYRNKVIRGYYYHFERYFTTDNAHK